MRSTGLKLSLCAAVASVALAAGHLSAAAPDVFEGRPTPQVGTLASGEERASTIPSKEIELSFSLMGLIDEVKVKDGDKIKPGQLLAKQDTAVEEAALAREEFLLKSNVQARAAKAQLALAKVKLARAEKLFKADAGSTLELEEAKLEVEVSELKVELADEETEAKRLEIVKLKKQIERMQVMSPIEGIVRDVEAAKGEVSDPQKPSIVVVSNNPLKVEAKLPTHVTAGMELGQTIQVRYIEEQKWRNATIRFFDPVADATTGTQLVHLELPNAEGRRAGLEMAVKLPENVAAAK